MRCVGVAEIRFIKYFRDEGVWKNTGFHQRKPVEAAALPGCQRACHRRSGGGGVTCKLHVAAHAACQASQSDSRSLPLPCHRALAALQPQTACHAASLTDLQAAAARALFKPRGLAMSRQDCNSTTRPFAWSAELRYRANFNRITAGGPLGMLHLPVPHCSMPTPTTAPPAPLGNLQSLQLHDHTATLVRSVRVI